ncbi:hypothetical protein BJY00DRAFT_296307 [Aspergillus carlsbadensis]|nr:hypothetical protein BJY00DRAFT_296307 [Aspergillus carlsbadensis]
MNEDIATLWNVSAKFEETAFHHTVLCAFETLPTKYSSGNILSRRSKVLVDKPLASTSLASEKSFGSNANHKEICSVLEGSEIHEAISDLAARAVQLSTNWHVSQNTSHLTRAAHKWLPTPVASEITSEIDANLENLDFRDPISSRQATAGSEQISDLEILPAKGTSVSEIPAVKLPCYVFDKHHIPGECYGRQKTMDLLDKALLPSKPRSPSYASQPVRSFAICGPGGIGKTEIAVEFVTTRKHQFDAVFWVHADNEVKLAENFNAIAAKLGLVSEIDEGNSVVSRDRLLEWLNHASKSGRGASSEDDILTEELANWLLVFDNADDPGVLAEYWPHAGGGAILVTSRDPVTKSHFFSMSGIDLDPFDRTSAAVFLQALTGYHAENDYEEALALVDRLDGLPLALVQIASILQRQDLSFGEFLNSYNDRLFLTDVHSTAIAGLREKNKKALFNVWQFEHLNPPAQKLLDLIALLDPDAIPELIFTHPELQELAEKFPVTTRTFEPARTGLLRSSLIRRLKNEKAIRIHRVIQDAALARMSPVQLSQAFTALVQLVDATWPRGAYQWSHEVKHWVLSSRLMPHIERLRQLYMGTDRPNLPHSVSEQFAKLLVDAAWYHMERGNHPSMIPFLECAEALLINAGLESSMSMASCHFALSACLQWLRDPEKARYHCDENIRISLIHGDEPNASIAFTELGVYYLTVEQYQEAIDTFQKSIDIQIVCGARETDPGLIQGARWLGTFPKCYSSYALLQLGRLEEAESLLIPVLEWFKKEWGLLNDRSYRTGFAMLHLGNVRAAQGRLAESFEMHEMALRQYRMTLGNSHPHTAGAMLKVSEHYVRLGRKGDAMALLEEALKVWSNRAYFRPERAWTLYKKSVLLRGDDDKSADELRSQAEQLVFAFAGDMRLEVPRTATGEVDYAPFVMFFFK